ncbi:3-isopropylmalate dehydratase large subunit [Sandaracinus amylolyticus]|uniref:3-isopropylmalate dehydratase large subunit n=1 Tax=Sandaracinus amylolyticus TaxID=927083 RepID=UPI001F008967|nr:3-isopropylmalate dehydratase large subunit [Sandaracinus amylolyticus]UJR79330.1 3-isopropylmalate dehydratase large subunit [Sandaracinus amylolyticus]
MSAAADRPRTMFDKIWESHVVAEHPKRPAVLYIDLHLVHEVTSPQAFSTLRERNMKVRRPDRTLATMDHSTPTRPGGLAVVDSEGRRQLEQLMRNCADNNIELYSLGTPRNGIVHVVGPEMGRTQPGMTIVCGDSHTSTHGAFGALAFGIGTSEVAHVLATQCLLQRRPEPVEVLFGGRAPEGVTAKDLVLALIAQIGVDGGTGCVFEYRGEAVRQLSMEGRMTLCNMSIEAGARAGLVAPDDTTYQYLHGRPGVPKGEGWDRALARWRALPTDEGARFAKTITIDVSRLAPMITWGTNPAMAIPIDAPVPRPEDAPDSAERAARQRAIEYTGLEPGKPLLGKKIDVVFIGSCTNSRLSDLREAAAVLAGRKVKEGVRAMVVPGSHDVKKAAEAEGLHEIFKAAGAEWREPGCSMCIAMNEDRLTPGQYAVSTSNRNFEGRQGPGSRTFLASPRTAAACAIAGVVVDPRKLPFVPEVAA